MDGVDANGLELAANVDGGQHSSVGRGLLSVSLDFHTTGDTGVGFTAGEISNVDEGVVLGGLNVANTERVDVGFGAANLRWAVVGLGLLFLGLGLLGFLVNLGCCCCFCLYTKTIS